ncbi:MAG: hypothetical protein VCD33_13275, partial [Alphaproteobacteria bacterium]
MLTISPGPFPRRAIPVAPLALAYFIPDNRLKRPHTARNYSKYPAQPLPWPDDYGKSQRREFEVTMGGNKLQERVALVTGGGGG